ncbi:hypothetical protein GmHk_18G050626 [Glycine max]|nr:hypothetical protein GmHk_18G050626 [Glycine max]
MVTTMDVVDARKRKMRKFVGLFLLVLVSVAVAEYDNGYPEHENEKNGPCGKFSTLRILTHKLRHCEKAARDAWAPVSSQCCNDLVEVSIPCLYAVFSSDAFKRVGVDPRVAITIPHLKMSKFVGVFLLLLITVTVAEYDHGYPEHENEKNGPCGKFSTLRILTHKLRHCEKAARNAWAPVSSQCCNDLVEVSIPCLYAVFSSDAFKRVGVDPRVAITIPHQKTRKVLKNFLENFICNVDTYTEHMLGERWLPLWILLMLARGRSGLSMILVLVVNIKQLSRRLKINKNNLYEEKKTMDLMIPGPINLAISFEEFKILLIKNMGKFVGLFLLVLVSVAVAEYDNGYPEHENEKNGPCGKFSTLRILTHKLRHCEKAARDAWAPVSSQCCNDLVEVSIPCLYAVFSSDAFKRVGVDPRVAITIPHLKMSKFVGVFLLLLITVTVAEYDHSYPEHENEKNGPCGKFSTLRILTHKLRHCEKAARNAWVPVSSQCCNDLVEVSIPCLYAVFSSDAFKRVGVDPRMSKFVGLLLLLLITVAIAEYDHHPEHEKHGPCGKFSTQRMLTHKLRHCEKAARSIRAPVSSQCCKDLAKVSIPCLHAVFSSDAFKKVGVDPKIAITIPHRCHFAKP